MSRSDATYHFLERVFGRDLLWRVGRWLYTGARREMSHSMDANGEIALQKSMVAHFKQTSHGDPIVLDIGANLGAWSQPFGRALHSAGITNARLIAFEPGPGQRERLEVNLSAAPGFGTVTILPYAVGVKNGSGAFAITGDETGSSGLVPELESTDRDVEVVEVEIRTLDSLLPELGLDHVDLVKVDTEGNDLNVLSGAIETLRAGKIGAIQFEYNYLWLRNRFSLDQVFRFIDGLDYRFGKVVPDGIELYDKWHFELDRYIMTNCVLVRSDLCAALNARPYQFSRENTAIPRSA